MAESARVNLGCVVRAGESYQGKQGPNYTSGISAGSVGSRALWLGSVTQQRPYEVPNLRDISTPSIEAWFASH
jgi:uncharacterized RmlC-like cupin family protein